MSNEQSEYSEIFGREPEPWRQPLGALRLTLTGEASAVDVERAQAEIGELVKVLNQHPPDEQGTEEPEYEYARMNRLGNVCEPDDDLDDARRRAAQSVWAGGYMTVVRRRKAGPWEPVKP